MRACCRDTSGSTSAMADVPVGKHPRTVPVSSQDSLWMGGRKAPSTKRMRPSWGRGLAVEDACRGDGLVATMVSSDNESEELAKASTFSAAAWGLVRQPVAMNCMTSKSARSLSCLMVKDMIFCTTLA